MEASVDIRERMKILKLAEARLTDELARVDAPAGSPEAREVQRGSAAYALIPIARAHAERLRRLQQQGIEGIDEPMCIEAEYIVQGLRLVAATALARRELRIELFDSIEGLFAEHAGEVGEVVRVLAKAIAPHPRLLGKPLF